MSGGGGGRMIEVSQLGEMGAKPETTAPDSD